MLLHYRCLSQVLEWLVAEGCPVNWVQAEADVQERGGGWGLKEWMQERKLGKQPVARAALRAEEWGGYRRSRDAVQG